MKIDRGLELRAYRFYECIDEFINNRTGSVAKVHNALLSILMYVIWEGEL